jgi:hypothetical protein
MDDHDRKVGTAGDEPGAASASDEDERQEGPAGDDSDGRIGDDATDRDSGDFGTLLEQALAPFLSSVPVSLSGNFFLGETRLQDAVAGDKYSAAQAMSFSGLVDSGRVPDPVLDEIRATFVQPKGHRQLEEHLSATAVVLYRAPSGRGATTSALRALDSLSEGHVWKLNPEIRLGSLQVRHMQEGGGYYVESLEPEQALALRPFHLERLSSALKERRCRLAVRLGPGVPLPQRESLGEWLCDSPALPPDEHELVRRHVAYHMDIPPDDPRLSFLEQAEVRELVDAAVTDRLPVRRIADLSTLLTLVGRGQADVSDVRNHFSTESEERFAAWFDEQRAAGRLAFALSLAILDQLQESAVDRACRLLATRLDVLERRDGDEAPNVFGEPRKARLAAARAESYDTVAMTPYGPGVARGLRYLDSRVPQRLLWHVWTEHAGARPVLMDWLRELTSDRARIVRLRAGGALGLVALHDFEYIRREFLFAWARDDDIRHREVVLAALRVPAREPGLAPLVSRMVEDWSRPSQPAPVRRTAARALGASVGRTIAARALRLLKGLAAEPDEALVTAVVASVTELFMDHEKDLTGLVLDHLLLWTDSDDDAMTVELRDAGITCFLHLCRRVRVEVPEGTMPWPTMLWLTTCDERHRRRVAALLARTLEAPRLFGEGYGLLHQWVRLTRHEPRLREPIGALLPLVAPTPQDAAALRGQLVEWRADDGTLKETISVLLESLDGRGESGGLDGREDPE